MTSVVFMPNVSSRDFSDLFRQPAVWEKERRLISGFGFYSYHLKDDLQYDDWKNENNFEAVAKVEAFRLVRDWGLRTVLEMGAVKEWDCDGKKNLAELDRYIDRIAKAGGELNEVAIDEPLASTIAGAAPRDYEMCFTVHEVHRCAQVTAGFVRAAKGRGLRVTLAEAYPQHPVDRTLAFLRHVVVDERAPIDGFDLDYDRNGASDQRKSQGQIEEEIGRLREGCTSLGMSFGVIATELGAETAAEYCKGVREHLDFLLRASQPEEVTVQSWLKRGERRDVPHNLPTSDPTSHVALLRYVAGRVG